MLSNVAANTTRPTFTFEVEGVEIPGYRMSEHIGGWWKGEFCDSETKSVAHHLSSRLTRMWRDAFRAGDAAHLAVVQVVGVEGIFEYRGHHGIRRETGTSAGAWQSLHFTGRIRVRLVTRQRSAVIATFREVARRVFQTPSVHTAPSAQLMRQAKWFRPTTIWRQSQVDCERLEAQGRWTLLKRTTPRNLWPISSRQ